MTYRTFPPGSLHIDHADPRLVELAQILLLVGRGAKCECPEEEHLRECHHLSLAVGILTGVSLKHKKAGT